jgi:hypothetical protein
MKTLSATFKALTCAIFVVTLSAAAQAQTRTWVSGVGDDLNPCSRTAPCKTFAGAISKTSAGGEIDALDSGGYGTVTLTKSMTIDGAGYLASILYSGTNGVNVNDSATATPNTIVVTLRRLSFNGAGTGTNGINFVSGKTVNVEDCRIFGSNTAAAAPNGAGIRVGLSASGANLNVKNTSIFRNRVGITATTSAAGGNFTMNVNGCHIENNTGDGIFLDARAFATVRNTNLAFNGGAGVSLNNAAANSATIDDSELNHNQIGIFVGTGTTVRLGRSLVTQNGTNFSNSGSIVTFCNNETETTPIPGAVTQNCLK